MIRAMQPIHWTLGQHPEPHSPSSAASHGHLSVVSPPFFRRGTCTNAIALQQDIVDRALLGLIAEVLDAPIVDRAVDKRWLGSGAGGRSTWTAVPEVERRKLSEPAGIESFDDANLKRERRACGRRKAAPGREQPPKPGYCGRGELAIGNLISGAATKTSDWRGPNGT